VAQWVTLVNEYVDGAPAVLRGLANHAQAMQSAAGLQVVSILHAYLQNRDDFVPDSLGKMGLLDDAWLILNTAFRLVESGIVPAQCVPLRWDVVAQVDHMVQALLPPPVLSALEGMIMQMLQLIAAEIQDYQPWFTPQAGSYRPVIATPTASGGCWEDQMNAALLGTGLSV
jgi:hypothetical protein